MEILIIFLPLLSFLFILVFKNSFHTNLSNYVPTNIMLVCCLYSIYLFFKIVVSEDLVYFSLFTWITSGNIAVRWSFNFDILTAVMMIVTTSISFVVHIYSIDYIKNDILKPFFMGYLALSTFSMLILISSNNLIQFFLGWQLVGFSSFLLIGHFNNKIAFNKSAVRFFIINKISDLFMILSLVIVYFIFDTLSFEIIFETVQNLKHYNFYIFNFNLNGVEIATVLLCFSAIIRSSQLFFYLWSSNSFEIPIPTLALLYSSTFIPTGIFILIRFFPLIEHAPLALNLLIYIGSFTVIFSTSIALTEYNLKNIMIYAACSQLGIIIIAIGLSAYNIAMFHFVNYAFFNSLLFLSVGSIISFSDYRYDVRKIGGLYSKLPVVLILMYIGSLSISGIPFFSGFYSKDSLLLFAYSSQFLGKYFVLFSIFLSSLLVSFICWRVIFLSFHGEFKGDINQFNKFNGVPFSILTSMFLLAIMVVFSGWLFYDFFVGVNWPIYWKDTLYNLSSNKAVDYQIKFPSWVKYFSILLSILGIFLATLLYLINRNLPDILIHKFKPLYLIFYNKWFLNKLVIFLTIKYLELVKVFLNLFLNIFKIQETVINKKKISFIIFCIFLKTERFYRKKYITIIILFFSLTLFLFYLDIVFIYDF